MERQQAGRTGERQQRTLSTDKLKGQQIQAKRQARQDL